MQNTHWSQSAATADWSSPPVSVPYPDPVPPATFPDDMYAPDQFFQNVNNAQIHDPWAYSTPPTVPTYYPGKAPLYSAPAVDDPTAYPYFSTTYDHQQPPPAPFAPPLVYPQPQIPNRIIFSEQWSEQGLKDHAAFEQSSLNMPLRRRGGSGRGGGSASPSHSDSDANTASSHIASSIVSGSRSAPQTNSASSSSIPDGRTTTALVVPRLQTEFHMSSGMPSSASSGSMSAISDTSLYGYSSSSPNTFPSPLSPDSPVTHPPLTHTHTHTHFQPPTHAPPASHSRHAKPTRGQYRHEEYARPPPRREWDMQAGLSTFPANPNISLVRGARGSSAALKAPLTVVTRGTIPNGPPYNPHGHPGASTSRRSPPPAYLASPPPAFLASPPPAFLGSPARLPHNLPVPSTSRAPPPPPSPEHHLTETHTISHAELDKVFRATGDNTAEGGRKAWLCPTCEKCVRKQDRASHHLGHQGKKRYQCKCGKRFGRPQDADRHIREQAPCIRCEGKMGRYGKGGHCSSCVLEVEQTGGTVL